jgi:hypothetical protein
MSHACIVAIGATLLLAATSTAGAQAAQPAPQQPAGFRSGFYIASPDGNNELRIGFMAQVRYMLNQRDEGQDPLVDEDLLRLGVQYRRLQVNITGHVMDPRFTYRLRIDSDNAGTLAATYAWVGFAPRPSLVITAGQVKTSFLHEEDVADSDQLVAERSYSTDYFTTDFGQGVQALWQAAPRTRVVTTVHKGSYGMQADFSDRTDIAVTSRVEHLLVGKDPRAGWRQAADFPSWPGQQPIVVLSAAGDHEQGESGGPASIPSVTKWTVDAKAKWKLTSAFVAVVGQTFSVGATPAAGIPAGLDGAHQTGVLAQLTTFLVPETVNPFVRYERMTFDGVYYRNDRVGVQGGSRDLTDGDELRIITAGLNYYIKRHNAKFTLDALYALDPVPVDNSGQGLLRSAAGDQLAVRAQWQLKF